MNSLDIIIVIPLLLGFMFGLSKGFIREILSIAVIIFGIYASKWLSPIAASMLTGVFGVSETVANPLSFVVVFIAIAIALRIVAASLSKFVQSISLGGLNKLFGGIFGALKYALLLSLLANIFQVMDSKMGILKPEMRSESLLYKPIMNLAPQLWNEVKELKTDNTAPNP